MKFLLFQSFLSVSSLFILLTHPLSMGLTLLIQVTLISLLTGYMNMNFWFSYILFLIMVGGMLVLFIYMTSIASNEMFKLSSKMIMMTVIILIMSTFTMQKVSKLSSLKMDYNPIFLSKFINYPSNILMFMMILYLFITLIVIVKISKIEYGPIRQKN
uniref:NADH-ubiquinone oxidoreductase chain 6 n=1 Tax=Paromalus flavicornis TaxID=154191 RepID=A0A0S2MPD1_9COLE|nr:NADH deshydrogenase subunit 6 [Paromalus flavicornis]